MILHLIFGLLGAVALSFVIAPYLNMSLRHDSEFGWAVTATAALGFMLGWGLA